MKDGLHIDKFGNHHYYKNDQYHNDNGPAFISKRGCEWWLVNGKFHRTNGPAICYYNGNQEFFINGIKLSYEEFLKNK